MAKRAGANGVVMSEARDRMIEFLHAFRAFPQRISGDYHEQRAARLVMERMEALGAGKVTYQAFAQDQASGTYSVSLHAWAAFWIFVALIPGGALLSSLSAPGAFEVFDFGPIPGVPLFAGILMAGLTLAVHISRLWNVRFGKSLFSYLIQKTDSANILAEREPAAPARRLVILMAHYDSARCLPDWARPGSSSFSGPLGKLVKGGISVFPSLGLLCLWGGCVAMMLGAWTVFPLWARIVFCVLEVLAIGVTLAEAIVSTSSAELPAGPGYNDNLSGCAVIAGVMARLKEGPALKDTKVMAVFTGGEESGLHGAHAFRELSLGSLEKKKGARAVPGQSYALKDISILNFDSVSGPYLRRTVGEKDFVGILRRGCDRYENQVLALMTLPMQAADIDTMLVPSEKALFIDPVKQNVLALEAAEDPYQSCTDLSALLGGDKNHRLRAVGFGAPTTNQHGVFAAPRDYHSLNDTYETLFGPDKAANFGSLAALALATEKAIRALDAGTVPDPCPSCPRKGKCE